MEGKQAKCVLLWIFNMSMKQFGKVSSPFARDLHWFYRTHTKHSTKSKFPLFSSIKNFCWFDHLPWNLWTKKYTWCFQIAGGKNSCMFIVLNDDVLQPFEGILRIKNFLLIWRFILKSMNKKNIYLVLSNSRGKKWHLNCFEWWCISTFWGCYIMSQVIANCLLDANIFLFFLGGGGGGWVGSPENVVHSTSIHVKC